MFLFSRIRSLTLNLLRRDHVERELDAEVEAYLNQLRDEKIAAGVTPAEAHRLSRIELGGAEQVKESVRDVRFGSIVEQLWQDARHTLRILRKNPGFTAIAVITLALGIGVNTAIFSLVDGILLRPLPFEQPDRLVKLVQSQRQLGLDNWNLSQASFVSLRDNTRSFETVAAYSGGGANLTGDGDPERVAICNVSADFFKVLGRPPVFGRDFRAGEDTPGNNGLCVISFGFWQRRFGGDPNILGRNLNLNSTAIEVVGIMQAGFDFPRGTDIWIPIALNPARSAPYFLRAIGRLAPGVSTSDAETETTSVLWNYARQHPDISESRVPLDQGSALKTVVTPLKWSIVGKTQKPLLILLSAVGLVLLIACANVANLLLARATTRTREIAVRFALGASPSRVARQLLTESLVLALIGASVGVSLAWLGVRMLDRMPIDGIPRIETVTVEGRVLAFTAGLAVLTGLLFGLMPALRAYRVGMVAAMHEGGRGTSGSSRRANSALVAAQFALSFVLLIGAALMLKSFQRLQSVNPGFNSEKLLTMVVSLPARKYAKPEQSLQFYQNLLDRMRGLPGIRAAGLTTNVPFVGDDNTDNFIVEGHESETGGEGIQGQLLAITPGHLQTMGIPLLRGRDFLETDKSDSQPVAVVDETLARMYWPDGDALGKRVETTGDMQWMTIVGVVGGIKQDELAEKLQPHIYAPLAQSPALLAKLVIRSDAAPNATIGAVRTEVSALDRDIPVYSIRTMEDLIGRTLNSQRLTNLLLTSFSALALLLAAVGIYGTMSLYVGSRKNEFGIRMALGAQPVMLMRSVLLEGLALIGAGVAIGLIGALALTRAIASLLFDVSPTDPIVFIGVSLVLVMAALTACFVPARRASRVDPIIALRCE